MENVKTKNCEPTYVIAENAISSKVAATLRQLVDERGTKSIRFSDPDCFEYQIANPFSKRQITGDDKIESILPDLYSLGESCLRQANSTFGNNVCEEVLGYHGFWIVKYPEWVIHDKGCSWGTKVFSIKPPVVATAMVPLNSDSKGGEIVLYGSTGLAYPLREASEYRVFIWDGFTQYRVCCPIERAKYFLVIHYTGTLK